MKIHLARPGPRNRPPESWAVTVLPVRVCERSYPVVPRVLNLRPPGMQNADLDEGGEFLRTF